MPPLRALFYAATLGAALFTVHSALRGPPSLGLSITLFAAYLALLAGGIFRLGWRIFLDAVTTGPKASRGVALTFDDGPDPETTPRVLALLQTYKVTATFFLVAEKAEKHPELVRELLHGGHSIGLRSHHPQRFSAWKGERTVQRDLEEGIRALEVITGTRPTWFRPPGGISHPGIARAADALDLTTVGWSVGGGDGRKWTHEAEVLGRVRRSAKDGAILQLHDAALRGTFVPAGVTALPDLLAMLEEMRLPVVPLGPWIDAS